jgi:hypothetical protein
MINGLGAATENLVLKAHELKLEVITDVLPNLDDESKLIAVIRFFDKIHPQYADKFEPHICDDLVSTIPHRLTNRNIVKRQKIDIKRLEPLKSIVKTVEGADLILIDDEISTGNTFANLINAYKKINPHLQKVIVMSLLNVSSESSRQRIGLSVNCCSRVCIPSIAARRSSLLCR